MDTFPIAQSLQWYLDHLFLYALNIYHPARPLDFSSALVRYHHLAIAGADESHRVSQHMGLSELLQSLKAWEQHDAVGVGSFEFEWVVQRQRFYLFFYSSSTLLRIDTFQAENEPKWYNESQLCTIFCHLYLTNLLK